MLQENSAQQFPFQDSRSTKNTKLTDRASWKQSTGHPVATAFNTYL